MTDAPPPAAPAVRARLAASPPRRVGAVGMLAALAAMLAYAGLVGSPAAAGWTLFLLATAAASAWAAARLWRSSAAVLVLTDAALCEEGGRVLAPLDAIEKVERGLLAFKPSHGFALRLRAPYPAAFAPGLWWRVGRSVGVGGVTSRYETRVFADAVEAALTRRRA